MADWQSGLDDDQASIGHSIVAPLDAMGIDPDDAITNRAAVMARLNQSPMQRMQAAYQSVGEPPSPAPSASAAGSVGGAGAAPTAAAVSPTGGTTSAGPGKSLEQYGVSGLEGLETNMHQATQAAGAEPTEDPEEKTLEAQRATDAAAAPQAYDPVTGKPVAAYKEGVGGKILRGLEGVGLGLATGGIPGAIVGAIKPGAVGSTNYDAPTAQFGRDVERNQQTVASDDQQIAAAKDRFKQLTDARKNQAADYRAAAGLGKDLTTGATGMQNAQTDATTKPMEAQADLLKAQNSDPNAKLQLNAGQFQQRTSQADRLGLKGTNRTLYILNGKVPDPRQATAEEIATGQAEKIFRQQYGRGPATIEEFGKIQQMARGQQDRASTGNSASDRTLLRVSEGHLKSLQALRAKTFDADELKSLDSQIQTAQQDYDNAKSAVSGAPATAAPPASGAPVGGTSVAVIAPDGTRGVIPKANLKKALHRGYRQVTAGS